MLRNFYNNKLRAVVLKSRIDTCSFHEAMKYSLKLAQGFSFFPIRINNSTNYETLKFHWLYWRVAYSLITFSVFLFELVLIVHQTMQTQISLLSISKYSFHVKNFPIPNFELLKVHATARKMLLPFTQTHTSLHIRGFLFIFLTLAPSDILSINS